MPQQQQAASLTPMPKPVEPSQEWYPQALVLIVEERTCQSCSRTYAVPNPELMVRAINPLFVSAHDRYIKRSKWHGDTRDLPYEKRFERTTCERCPGCFEADPVGQLLMFPKPRPPRPTFAQVLEQKRIERAAERDPHRKLAKMPTAKQVEAARKKERAKKIAKQLFGDL